jgi:hypothetical protein
MSYAAPDKTTFTGLFPGFAAVTDEQYAFWSAQAVLVTEPMQDCLADRMDLATMLATAHYLTESGIGTGAESEVAAQGMAGFKSIRSGSITLDRGDAKAASDAGAWGTSSYGLRLYPMLKACLSGPRVTGTGCAVACGGFNGYAGPLPPYGDC